MTNQRGLLVPPPELAVLGLRAMKSVAGTLRPGNRRLLEAAQRIFLGVSVDLDALAPIEPQAFAEAFPIQALREQIVRGMVVLTLVDGQPDPAVAARVRAFAAVLGVDEPAIATVTKFAEGHLLLGRLDWLRRSNIKQMFTDEFSKGLLSGVKALLGLRGFVEDPEVAARFIALGELASGTLGRAFFEHFRSNGFPLPGERGGFPESGVYHDFTHVLTGYSTAAEGELQIGAFTAGFRKRDPMFVGMLPLLVFCADINVTPIPHEKVEALFAQADVAEKFIRAFERGSQVKVDLSDRWDFWPLVGKTLEQAREELGVVPA